MFSEPRPHRADAIHQVRQLMAAHGLPTVDLKASPSKRQSVNAGTKVAPMYRDPETGATWTARGLKQKWLVAAIDAGKSIADFAI